MHKSSTARLFACGCLCIGLSALSAFLRAQTSDRERAETLSRRAGERLQALQLEAERLASEEKTLLGELRKLEVERELRTTQLAQVDTQIGQVQGELRNAASHMTALQEEESAARPKLVERLVETYKLGSARYVRLLLSTSDVRRLAEASRTVAALAKLDRDRVVEHERMMKDLTATRATLKDRETRLAALRSDALAAQRAAERAARAHDALVRDIDTRRDLNAQLSSELQEAQAKLQTTLRGISPAETPAAPNTEASGLPLKPFKGDLDWPVAGIVRRHMTRAASGRTTAANAIEIAAAAGAPVAAVHDGVVAYADLFPGFGNLVIVDHGAQTYSLYGNLLDINVTKGLRVQQGHPLGSVGVPPTASSPGLYFELRVDGQPVDPLQWLKKR